MNIPFCLARHIFMIVVNENVTHMKLKYPHMIIEKEIEKTLEIPQEQRDIYIYN